MRMDGFAYITELTDLLDKHNLPYPEAIVLQNYMYEDIEAYLMDCRLPWVTGFQPGSTRMKIQGITIIKGVSNV